VAVVKPILWVEDDPDDQALIAATLQDLGLADSVQFATDGEKALEALERSELLPVVIFLDFKLPKMDAPEVIERLRLDSRLEAVPLVVFTSSKSPTDADRVMGERGASCFISKPVDFEDFRLTIRQLIERWAPGL
jgi:CheY-like chemotaxis protein